MARVLSGSPVIELELLADQGPALEPGRPFVLLDGRGGAIASGVADPENEVIRILSRDAVDSFDLDFFRRRVSAAVELRRRLGLGPGGSSATYRLIHGEGDGLSGLHADVYGPFVVLYALSRGLLALGRLAAQAILEAIGPEGVVLKVRPKKVQPGKVKQETIGKEPPEKLVVEEHGVPHEVHLLGGLNVGLFTDMREHRRNLGRFTQGRRVLNTFAYTGSLSVAAARGGASEVTSVDLSTGVLKWAMENFRLSGIEPAEPRYRFVANDVIRFLKEERARKAEYDLVILDPPTYSAARAAGWSMKNDYPDLIALSAELLPRGGQGILWISSNVHRSRALLRHIQEGLAKGRRDARVLETGGLPPDYPTPLEYPEARYLEVCYVAVA